MRSFVILGLSRFGRSVAKTLYQMGQVVLVIDENEELIQNIADYVTYAMVGNVNDENVLKAAGIKDYDAAVVSTGKDLGASILVIQTLKDMGIKYIVAKAQNEMHAKVLNKLGVDRVVFPEQDMGERVARNLVLTNIIDYIELSPEYTIIEIKSPQRWENKTLKKLNVRAKYGIYIIAIKNGLQINVAPDANYIVKSDDILVVIGSNSEIDNLNRSYSS